jgi:hypothetical protein
MVRAKFPTLFRVCARLLLLAVLAAPLRVFAADTLVDPIAAPYWQPAMLPFAGELEGGPVRILLIAPTRTLRDGVELTRRLPSRLDVLPISDIERDAGLLGGALGRAPEVIVLANFDFNRLPEAALAAIIDRNANGSGLLLVQRHAQMPEALRVHLEGLAPLDDVWPLTRGTGLELVPDWQAEYAFVDARENEAVRALELTYLADLPTFHCLIPAPPGRLAAEPLLLDSYFTVPARALLWAARREPEVWIAEVEEIRPPGPDLDEVPPFLPEPFIESQQRAAAVAPLATYRVRLNEPARGRYTVRTRIRYPYRDISWHTDWDKPWREGEETFDLQLPAGSGELLVDIWVEGRRNTVDWFTLAQNRPGLPSIESFLVPRRVVRPVDTLEISLRLGPYAGPQSGPVTVLARATDAMGRVVGEHYRAAPDTETDFSTPLQINDAKGGFVKVEVFVAAAHSPFEAGQLERATHQWTYLPVQRPYDRAFSVWADGAAGLELTVRGLNEELAVLGVDTIAHHYAFDFPEAIAWTPLHVAPAMQAAAPLPWRLPCLLSEAYVEGLRDTAVHWATVASAGFVLPASGYAPAAPAALVDAGRACVNDFVEFLTGNFGDFEQFGGSVNPNAQNWDDVLLRWDASDSGALRRMWREYVSAKTAETLLIERAALAGGRGIWEHLMPEAGAEVIVAADGAGVPADLVAIERVGSYQTAGSGNLLRLSAMNEDGAAWAWHAALHQLNGVWLTDTYADAHLSSLLAPDGRPAAGAVSLSTTLANLVGGHGALLQRAERTPDGIAIYDNGHDAQWRQNVAALLGFLEASGLQQDFVNESQISRGIEPFRLIVLPDAAYLSDGVVEALDVFVANGGRLLADVAPATQDQWGEAHNGSRGAEWFANPAGEQAHPQSLLLGMPFVEALRERDTARRVRAWLVGAGLVPVDESVRRNSIDFSGERHAYVYGKGRIFGYSLAPYAPRSSERFRIGFDKDAFAYDLVAGEPLIGGNWSVARVSKDQPALYSVLPYEVTRLVVSAAENVVQGQRLVFDLAVKTKDDLPGTHLIHARVLGGIDMALDEYDQVIECSNGQGTGYIPVAYDELPLTYTLEVRDLLSGTRAQHQFTVRDRGN